MLINVILFYSLKHESPSISHKMGWERLVKQSVAAKESVREG